MTDANNDTRRGCYWCGARRLVKNLRRVELSGPARRRVYECRVRAQCSPVAGA